MSRPFIYNHREEMNRIEQERPKTGELTGFHGKLFEYHLGKMRENPSLFYKELLGDDFGKIPKSYLELMQDNWGYRTPGNTEKLGRQPGVRGVSRSLNKKFVETEEIIKRSMEIEEVIEMVSILGNNPSTRKITQYLQNAKNSTHVQRGRGIGVLEHPSIYEMGYMQATTLMFSALSLNPYLYKRAVNYLNAETEHYLDTEGVRYPLLRFGTDLPGVFYTREYIKIPPSMKKCYPGIPDSRYISDSRIPVRQVQSKEIEYVIREVVNLLKAKQLR